MMGKDMRNIISLAELQAGIQETLKKYYSGPFWIIAEISEVSENMSGHCYLDLVEKDKDSDTILAKSRATIWAFTYRMLKPYFETTTGQPLKRGMKILVQAGVEHHPVYSLSLNIKDIDPAYTLGEAERRRKEIILRLEKEGVIGMNRELPLPLVPQKIAVISSGSAAGYRDFMEQLGNNPYGYMFYARLFPALMQGEKAAESIIASLDAIHQSGFDFDLVVILRGGGARADLDCFDSYELAYYVTQFPVPVITGIGHEQDDTITDLVANTKLKTPTAVAGFLVDALLDFESQLEARRRRIIQACEGHLVNKRLRLQLLGQKIASVSDKRLSLLNGSIIRLSAGMKHHVSALLEKQRSLIDKLDRIATYVDPAQVLRLGYSISRKDGKAIRDASRLSKGDIIETTLSKGRVKSSVQNINKKDELYQPEK